MIRPFLCLLFAASFVHGAAAQAVAPDLAARITDTLVADGYTNVAAAVEGTPAGTAVRVTYENSRYRYGLKALQRVMQRVMPLLPADAALTLIPQRHSIPLVAVTATVAAFAAMQDGTLTPAAFTDGWTVTTRTGAAVRGLPRETHRSYGRVDLVVVPQFTAQLGNFEDAVESQINLAPALRVSFWKGMQFTSQLVVPVQNDLGPGGDDVRPGLITLSQAVRLPWGFSAMVTAGYFTQDRYGVDVEAAKLLLGGRLLLHARGGRTGFATYRSGQWRYAGFDAWTGAVGANALVLPAYAFEVHAAYGRFLFADTGWRLGVRRTFGEVQIGFYGLLTDAGDNAGFSIVLPLVPSRYPRPRRVRARPAAAFAWEYRYRKLPEGGHLYATGTSLDPYGWDVAPPLVKQLGGQLRGWR